MANVNSIVIEGRMVKDAEVKYTSGGMAVGSFNVAVNYYDGKEKKEVASFFDIKCFGHDAEYVGKYGGKGAKITVQGELRQERWTSKEGENRSKVVIISSRLSLEGKKEQGQQQGFQGQQGYQQPQRQQPQQNQGYQPQEYQDTNDNFPEEIPF